MGLPSPYDARCRAVVDRLSMDFQPARRLWPVNARLALWIALELAILASVAFTYRRPDLFAKLHEFSYTAESVAFLLVGTLAGALALRNAIPGREVTKLEIVLLCGIGVVAGLSVLLEPVRENITLVGFILAGLPCLGCTVALAAVPWMALFWAVRRGIPMAVEVTGGLIGAASFSYAFAASRLGCPIDDLRHVVLWHVLPILLGVGLSTLAGIAWLRRKRQMALP